MIELNEAQYEILLDWAKTGAGVTGVTPVFLAVRKKIDAANSIQRFTLVIRYEGLPQTGFVGLTPSPREKTKTLEQKRPFTRDDVILALKDETYLLNQVYVTMDPLGEIGFYELDAFPWDRG